MGGTGSTFGTGSTSTAAGNTTTGTAPGTATNSTTATTATATPQPFGQTGTFTVAFSEDFNGTALDTTKWNDRIWYEAGNATKNYAVSNGSLK
nr:glycoside hydrolase family 16 protein [Oxalobacteraceae bacterium]